MKSKSYFGTINEKMEPPKPPLIRSGTYSAFTGATKLPEENRSLQSFYGFNRDPTPTPTTTTIATTFLDGRRQPEVCFDMSRESSPAPKPIPEVPKVSILEDPTHYQMSTFMYKNKELTTDAEGKRIDVGDSLISFTTEWKEKRQSLFFRKYYEEISREKEEIDKLNNNEIWDKMKKIGNPFELIFTTYHRKRKNDSISKYIPLSRSYFKMWEIYNNFPIFQYFPLSTKFRLAHLAEGPGGFMEASYNYIQHLRTSHYHKTQLKQMMNKDVYHGITLKPHNDYVPDWNKIKKIFGPESNIHVHYGNLYVYEDVVKYCGMFKDVDERAHIVTADGGFDYSSDFNGQELNSCQIIYSEMAVALNVLAKHGTFICKVFDLFSIPMMKMLEILKQNFEYLYIYKPETSRPANSEKYIVCMNYLDILTQGEKDHLLKVIQEWNNRVTSPSLPPVSLPPKPDAMMLVNGKPIPAHLLNDPNNDSLSCACCGNTKKEEMMITAFLKAQKKLLGIKENGENGVEDRDGESDPKESIGNLKRKKKKSGFPLLCENVKEKSKEESKEEFKEESIEEVKDGLILALPSGDKRSEVQIDRKSSKEESKEVISSADHIRQNYYIDFSGIKVSKELIYLLNDYNNKYMECQKRSLQKTLNIAKKNPSSIIEKEDYEMLIRQQVKNAYNWCTKYNIPVNEESIYWQKYKGFI